MSSEHMKVEFGSLETPEKVAPVLEDIISRPVDGAVVSTVHTASTTDEFPARSIARKMKV